MLSQSISRGGFPTISQPVAKDIAARIIPWCETTPNGFWFCEVTFIQSLTRDLTSRGVSPFLGRRSIPCLERSRNSLPNSVNFLANSIFSLYEYLKGLWHAKHWSNCSTQYIGETLISRLPYLDRIWFGFSFNVCIYVTNLMNYIFSQIYWRTE